MKRRTLNPNTHKSLMDYWRYWEAKGRDIAWVITSPSKRTIYGVRK